MWGWDFTFNKRFIRNSIFSIFLLAMTMGFRTYPNAPKWAISLNSPKLWVKFCDRTLIANNDLPSGDPLFGQALSFASLSQSILDDYNNIQTSYVRLFDADTDPTFSATQAANHTINVCYGGVSIGHSGWTTNETQNGLVVKADITLSSDLKSSAKKFAATVTHELGHALGLDHPQETNFSIMSYFRDVNRLQIDDKMGITFLYPINPSYGQESPTFGLSCAGR